MSVLQILNKTVTYSNPPFVIVDYLFSGNVPAGLSMSDTAEMSLVAQSMDHVSANLCVPNQNLSGQAFAILVNSFAISCLSEKYDVKIFNKSGSPSSLLNTNNEIMFYDDVELSILDTNLGEYVIVNRDAPMINKLYLYVINNGAIDTGPISVTMYYNVLQNRPS